MKLNIKYLGFLLVVFSIVAIASCNKGGKTNSEEYLIQVDSIQVADTVNLGSKFSVVFFGIIGYDGCSSFSRFIAERETGRYKLQVVGKRKTGPNIACPEYLPMLDGEKLELLADSSGVLKIEIVNPGLNQILSKEIFVRN
jgi:hypothetical protein